MRSLLVYLHRYVGLVIAGFLLIAAITGSLLAWNEELEALISPELLLVHPPAADTSPMDRLALRDQVAALYPSAKIVYVPLKIERGRAVTFFLKSSDGADLANDQVFVNPYTGAVLGERKWGILGQGMKNVMPFVYRLHLSLGLDTAGAYALGIAALLWTLDCFVAGVLTFPAKSRLPSHSIPTKRNAWLVRWLPAWKIRLDSSRYKLLFDLHRAGSLWLWGMLLVFAWSSVAFTLPEVYAPVMRSVLKHQPDIRPSSPDSATPAQAISWAQALHQARSLMAQQSETHGFRILEENGLVYDESRRLYRYWVRSSLDVDQRNGATSIYIDSYSGQWIASWLPTKLAAGDTLRTWIATLHRGSIWGWPYQVFVFFLGAAVATLSSTGVIIWHKKRRARRLSKSRLQT